MRKDIVVKKEFVNHLINGVVIFFSVYVAFLLANKTAERALKQEVEIQEESRKKEAILLLHNLKNEMQLNISAIDGTKDMREKGIYQRGKETKVCSPPVILTDEIWKMVVSSNLIASFQDPKSIYYFATIYRKIHLQMAQWEELRKRSLLLLDASRVERYNTDSRNLSNNLERTKCFCNAGIEIANFTISRLKGEISQETYEEKIKQIPEITELNIIIE